MSEDNMEHSLEDLFSDFEPPVPEGEVEPSPAPPPSMEEREPVSETEPSPPFPPPTEKVETPSVLEVEPEDLVEDVQVLRRQLLRSLLYAMLIIGAPAAIGSSYNAYVSGRTFLIPWWGGAFLLLLVVTFWRRISYNARAGVFLSLVYGLGVLDLLESGRSGDGALFLLAFPLLAIILTGQRVGIITLILSTLTRVIFGWAFSTGQFIPLEQQASGGGQAGWWWSSGIVFALLGAGLVVSQNYLVPRITRALSRSHRLTQQLKDHQARLKEQTRSLQRRTVQLEISAEVARMITSILEIDQLLQKAVELIRDHFDWYFVSIFLLDERGENAVIKAGTGEAGAQMVTDGFQLNVAETSLLGWSIMHRQPRVALNVEEDRYYRPHPLLPETSSEVVLPLLIGDQILGVLDIESKEVEDFEEGDVQILQGLANQIAVAIQNARRVSDEATLLEVASPVYRVSRLLTTATTAVEVADAIIDVVTETGVDGCLVVEFENSSDGEPEALLYRGVWRRDQSPRFRPGVRLPFSESPFPVEVVQNFWVAADVERDEKLPQSVRQTLEATGVGAVVNIPLRARGEVIGQVVVLRDTPGPFSKPDLRLYEAISDQASVALERTQLLAGAQRRAEQERQTRRVVDRIHRAGSVEQALQTTAKELSQFLEVPCVSIELSVPEQE